MEVLGQSGPNFESPNQPVPYDSKSRQLKISSSSEDRPENGLKLAPFPLRIWDAISRHRNLVNKMHLTQKYSVVAIDRNVKTLKTKWLLAEYNA